MKEIESLATLAARVLAKNPEFYNKHLLDFEAASQVDKEIKVLELQTMRLLQKLKAIGIYFSEPRIILEIDPRPANQSLLDEEKNLIDEEMRTYNFPHKMTLFPARAARDDKEQPDNFLKVFL
ncbi:hypothetical protein ACFORL_01920 [Legionella dresdenensis]|uniref:Coiled-coil protein n=1 Tax=Legionella dresdenensis TaxID=450200 RepID=A0ABV8CC02_9GAMM